MRNGANLAAPARIKPRPDHFEFDAQPEPHHVRAPGRFEEVITRRVNVVCATCDRNFRRFVAAKREWEVKGVKYEGGRACSADAESVVAGFDNTRFEVKHRRPH